MSLCIYSQRSAFSFISSSLPPQIKACHLLGDELCPLQKTWISYFFVFFFPFVFSPRGLLVLQAQR